MCLTENKIPTRAFSVQTFRKAHKKQHLDASVSFTESSQEGLVENTMSAKERGKLEDMAKVYKAYFESLIFP